ncbi:MAG: VPLPA-CTERM sorting domain-containing protein [Planctomycetota bacterium]
MAALAGAAVAQPATTSLIVNGGFDDPTDPGAGWSLFNNAAINQPGGLFPDPAGLLDNNFLGVFGTFSGQENFGGAAQTLVGWDFGDVITFSAEAYTSSGDSIVGTENEAFVAINAFDAGGNFLFNVPSVLRVNGSSPEDEIITLQNDFVVTQSLRGIVDRFEVVAIFRQPAGTFGGGSVFFDNISVTVPTPAAAGVLGLGGLVAARRRR